ncbi:MAG: menaquinone biosynthesis protein [Calditerrivibrio sp.]|nr:menaquinone biosynthesis protein [Calditerrivibrio sp.]MCA1932658.1 menaquinone biosynthesis protein [Calditerrivibrio sp.]MCA1980268.1 menaquinone biosynthesis protein [Calditerrivibrio sp.]
MLRIGEIQYANVYPIFHYFRKLNNPSFEFIKGVPSYLNKMMLDGLIDTSALSSIVYAKNPDSFLIIPEISISSVGEVKSVVLFSNFSKDNLAGKKIYLTDESGTSVLLLKIILKYFWSIEVDFTDEEGVADAFLYIGDRALLNYYNGSYPYKYDLGEEWYKFTGYPFVYALWLISRYKRDDAKSFVDSLMEIKAMSKKNLSVLIDEYTLKGLTTYQIIDYWETIDYNLTDKHLKGLLLYYQYNLELNVIDHLPALNFYI